MKYLSVVLVLLVLVSCTKKEGDTNTTQNIVSSDSSDVTGRLYVDAYDINGNKMGNTIVSLYISYDDIKRGITYNTLTASSSGRADFGYILVGNYYVIGSNQSGTLHDTTVAQVLPKRTISRKVFLR